MTTRVLRVVGISGSLRSGSYNTALLRSAAEIAPDDVQVAIADISGFPLYNRDVEKADGIPPSVAAVRKQIAEADGMLLATPEYNYSITGALKNAIDWLSRSPSPLDRIPAAILGTGGRLGTARAQAHLRDILLHNEVDTVVRPEVLVPGLSANFDDDGTLVNERVLGQIGRLLAALQRKMLDGHFRAPRILVTGSGDVPAIVRSLDRVGYRPLAEEDARAAGIDLDVIDFRASVDVAAPAAAGTRDIRVEGDDGIRMALEVLLDATD